MPTPAPQLGKKQLPQKLRTAIAQALNYKTEGDLYYWGSGAAIAQYERACKLIGEALHAIGERPERGGK